MQKYHYKQKLPEQQPERTIVWYIGILFLCEQQEVVDTSLTDHQA